MAQSTYTHKENRGSLFAAKEKKSDNHPDYTGRANINGAAVRISGWIEESKKGTKYLSLSFGEHQKSGQATATADDDLPF